MFWEKEVTEKREIHHFVWTVTDFISQFNAKLNFHYEIHQLDLVEKRKRKQRNWSDLIELTITCKGQFQISQLFIQADGKMFLLRMFIIHDFNPDNGMFDINRRAVIMRETQHGNTTEFDFEIHERN